MKEYYVWIGNEWGRCEYDYFCFMFGEIPIKLTTPNGAFVIRKK